MTTKQLDDSLSEKGLSATTSGKVNKIEFGSNGSLQLESDTSTDDKGLSLIGGQFSVGSPSDPNESVFGEGDSYPVGENGSLVFHFDYANLSGTTLTGATDITTILGSDTGSTTGLFDGTTAGKAVLVGSDYRYGGTKAKIDTLGDVEPENIISEYLKDDTPTWVQSLYMVTDADYPYEQKANAIGSCSSCSEQWRFGFDPTGTIPIVWDDVTLNINGTDYTKKWALFRITSTITKDIVLEQIKLHTSRYEVNSDGFTEYFGRSRYAKTIPITKTANALKNPANENVTIAVGITEIRTDNEFNNGANDGLILRGVVPEGLDTSIPVQLIIDWYPKGTGSGDVKLQLETLTTNTGFVYDGTAPVNTATPQITSIDNQEEELHQSTFLVSPFNSTPGDKIYGSLFRDASDAQDTYAANIVIVDYNVIGYFWKP